MGQRRMFSLKIMNSAKFIKMPIDCQNLYFHLGLRADDDGIVEAFSVMRLIGSPEDNLKLLHAKGFVHVLNDDLVTYITDWNEHNKLRSDRKIDSIYKDLLVQVLPDVKLLESRVRADRNKNKDVNGTSHGQPKDGLSKDKLSKVKTSKVNKIYYAEFVSLTVEEHQKLIDSYGESVVKKMIEILDNYKGSTGKKYNSDYRAILSWVVERVQNEKQNKQNDRYTDVKL